MPYPEPRSGILDMPTYMRGLAKIEGRDRVIKLSSNENPFGPSPLAVAAALGELDKMHLYPEAGQGALRSAIGGHFDCSPARIFCGAGSDQVLSMLVQAYAGPSDEIVFPAHGFAKFRLYAMANGAVPVAAAYRDFVADVDAILAAVSERTRIVAIANPDNPTSTCLSSGDLRRLHRDLPGKVLLLIDAAYADYVRLADYEPGFGMVDGADNVVMSRTFSKIFALAAMRIGWVYAPESIVEVLDRLEPSFPLTAPAIAAAIAALDDSAHTARSRAHNDEWLPRFSDRMRKLGLHVYPSQTNFVLIRFDDRDERSAEAVDAHLLSRGIIARRFLPPAFEDCLRITIGTEEELNTTADALEDFLRR